MSFTGGELLCHDPKKILIAVDEEVLHGLVCLAVPVSVDYLGTPYAEFEALPSHGFDENGQLELASAFDHEALSVFAVLHLYGDVSQRFFEKPLANLTRLNVFPLFASKGRGVDGEAHGHGGLLDLDALQGLR